MGVMTRHTFPKDLAPGIEAHLGRNLKKAKTVYNRVFQSKKTDRAWMEWVMTAGLGVAKQKPEGTATELDSMAQGWSAYVKVVSWGLGFTITQEAIEDNLYGDPMEIGSRELVQSFAQAKEIVHASILNFGFDSNYPMGDGVSLFNTAHPTIGHDTPSYRNTLAVQADFSEDTIEQACIDIQRMTNERGIQMNLEPVALVLPTELQFEEVRVMRNMNRPGTADRDISAIYKKGVLQNEPILWKFLTDPKQVTILTTLNEDEGLVTANRVAFSSKQWGDDRTGNYFVTARERYGVGARNPRAVFAFTGS